MADFLDSVLNRLAELAPEAAPRLPQIEREVRADWGGTEAGYIRKRAAAHHQHQLQALACSLQAGRPLQEAFAAAGVRRRRGYQLLAVKQRR